MMRIMFTLMELQHMQMAPYVFVPLFSAFFAEDTSPWRFRRAAAARYR